MALLNQPPRRPASHSDPANKQLFSHPRMVADLLRLLGEPWVDDLDLDQLARLPAEHVADNHRVRAEDMPWRAPFKPGAGHPPDGNVARAWLALEAADAGLAPALEHAARTFAGVGDATLSHGFAVWCRGVLPQRFGDRLRSLTDMMEKPTMLAETLQEWEEQKLNEGRLAGREEERERLRRVAERDFDAATANTLARLIEAADRRPESL